MIKKIVFSFLFFISISAYSQQEKINSYKYIIVPERFDFLKSSDQYQTSSLTKFLLEKKGFTVFLSNEKLPDDLLKNRCMALTATVSDDSGMFTIKNTIEIKDCFGNVLYTSKAGKSKEKEYKKGYHEAIRKAYATMENLEYSYTPDVNIVEKKDNIIKETIIPVKKDIPVKIIPEVKVVSPKTTESIVNLETLYAQAKSNGFQLVNTAPAVVFQIMKTNVNDVYIIKDKNGIIYKNSDIWVAEYYENNQLVVKNYTIKF